MLTITYSLRPWILTSSHGLDLESTLARKNWPFETISCFVFSILTSSLTQTSATVKFMTGSYLVAKLKGRILIQLEHHFLHLYVDILFVTYKNRFNQSSLFESTYQVQLFDRLFAIWGSLETHRNICKFWAFYLHSLFWDIFAFQDHKKLRNLFSLLCDSNMPSNLLINLDAYTL